MRRYINVVPDSNEGMRRPRPEPSCFSIGVSLRVAVRSLRAKALTGRVRPSPFATCLAQQPGEFSAVRCTSDIIDVPPPTPAPVGRKRNDVIHNMSCEFADQSKWWSRRQMKREGAGNYHGLTEINAHANTQTPTRARRGRCATVSLYNPTQSRQPPATARAAFTPEDGEPCVPRHSLKRSNTASDGKRMTSPVQKHVAGWKW